MAICKQHLLAAMAAILPLALAAPGISLPRSNVLGRQTVPFVYTYSKPGCADDDFVTSLATTNGGEIVGGDNCIAINSANAIPGLQQADGSYLAYIKPTTESLFGGSGEVVVRSPVQVDVQNCGVAVDTITSEGCFAVTLQDTFFLQTCLQSDSACAPRPQKREEPIQKLAARQDASCFSHGDTKTTLANDQTTTVSNVISCPSSSGCSQSITFEQSFSDTISIDISSGVEGLFSATFGVSFTQESSKSTTTTFNIPGGESGQITFTPILECLSGTTSSCGSNIPDGDLTMCRHTTNPDGSVNGVLSFVNEE